MSQPSRKLFVPDQAIYWLDAGRIQSKTNANQQSEPTDKHHWLATHNLPEFVESSLKEQQQSPWIRIEGTAARNRFLKDLGPDSQEPKRRLLCFTASAGVGKSIALEQIAYLRSLDPEHLVIRYHFSELPTNPPHFRLAGDSQRSRYLSGKTKTLVTALLKTIFPAEEQDPNWRSLTDAYEQAVLQWIELKIAQGHVTLIVDGLDELNADLKSETGAPGSDRARALSSLLYDGIYKNLHCVVAGRPYAIQSDYWNDLFESKGPHRHSNGGSDWEFCLASLFTEKQSKQYLGSRYHKLDSLRAQTPLTPRHLEVIRTLPFDRFENLHSLAYVYWEMLQASLETDLTRKGNVGPFERLNVPVDKEQYISYLAALASLTMENSEDLSSLRIATVRAKLNSRVLKTPAWQLAKDSAEAKIKLIAGLNSSSIEFNYLRQSNEEVAWKDRTVMDFFAALWMVRYSTAAQRKTICDQVPRRGKKPLDENRRDLWTFIAGMPSEALEHFDEDLSYDARWNELVQRLFQPFSDAKRPTQLMYIAWQELQRGVMDKTREGSVTQVMNSYTQQYVDLRNRGDEASKIIDEDLEGQYKQIPEPAHGWSRVVVGHKDYPDNLPQTVAFKGPYEVSAYPVTRRLYRLFDPRHEIAFQDDFNRHSPDPRCPAIKITWYDAMMFAAWVSARLMDEYEWEYSCRSDIGDKDLKKTPLAKYFWKDDPDGNKLLDRAWVGENIYGRTWPVDAKQDGSHTNGFGLVDMLGNVWEWTASTYAKGSVSRVLRGSSFNDFGRVASASYRLRYIPTGTVVDFGFRVARAPEGKS
jgi:formylglycine-generating enzyme required for sulfatase activity